MGRSSPSLQARRPSRLTPSPHLSRPPNSTPDPATPTGPVTNWITTHTTAITRHLALVTETAQTTTNPLASLSLVLRQLRTLS
jgi:hypothetical protein